LTNLSAAEKLVISKSFFENPKHQNQHHSLNNEKIFLPKNPLAPAINIFIFLFTIK